MKRIYYFFARMTTRTLIQIPYFLALISTGFGSYLVSHSPSLDFVPLLLFCFFIGLAGIPLIIRKDGFIDRDGWAVFAGILHLVLGWGFPLVIVIYNLFFR